LSVKVHNKQVGIIFQGDSKLVANAKVSGETILRLVQVQVDYPLTTC
jgi:hypothetical protein